MRQFLLANSFNCNLMKITLSPHVLSYPLHAYGCGIGSSFLDPASKDIKTSRKCKQECCLYLQDHTPHEACLNPRDYF